METPRAGNQDLAVTHERLKRIPDLARLTNLKVSVKALWKKPASAATQTARR